MSEHPRSTTARAVTYSVCVAGLVFATVAVAAGTSSSIEEVAVLVRASTSSRPALNPREHLAHVELARLRAERARLLAIEPYEHRGHRDVR